MKTLFIPLLCISALQLFFLNITFAQNKAVANKLQPPPSNLVIDGDLKDWGDSLRYYNQDKQLNYALANDQDDLYMAIRINDRSEQIRVLRAGLTISIDTRGKKKESFTMTFPVGDQSPEGMMETAQDLQNGNNDIKQEDNEELMKARLTKLREIKVTGFKDIESETMTTSNTYGFKVAIDYDKDGNLIYEAAIPLKFFRADDLSKNEWAFNFKINGITRPGQNKDTGDHDGMTRGGGGGFGGGGRGGRMGGGRGGRMGGGGNNTPVDRSELSKSVDFWEKYYLAK
ncbi:hypothetical protein [Mucilaginibacter sp. BT774]|uniref:hypothetical protein n=1 Tax=Mucilaginibacter sp. BT774 TaxID=3062276 RepID=UPI002675F9CB|nr:hypothetical protein [Mucilaginibacter sp. BT774]MDO3626870.1 hypothetical protein [Mucilaginibacter sp. BT774]